MCITKKMNRSNMNIDDPSEEKNSSEERIAHEGINFTMRRVLRQNLLAEIQQQSRERQEIEHRYLLQQLQNNEHQRQILQILHSRQNEARLRQPQPQGVGLLEGIDIRDHSGSLTPAVLLQLQLHQQRQNQQQLQQRIHEEELRSHQMQQLLLEQQERRRLQQFRFTQLPVHNNQASLQDIAIPDIRNVIRSFPLSGAAGSSSAGISAFDINRLQSAEIGSGVNVSSPHNILFSRPLRRRLDSNSNVGAPEVSGIDAARVQAAIFQSDHGNVAVANNTSGNDTESEEADSMIMPAWSETSAQLMKKMQKSGSKESVALDKKKSPIRRKVAGMPKRPLHAYNIFFQEERQRILSELPPPPDDDNSKYVFNGKRKRRRRATHGKISFSSLAKIIGEKWKAIENEQRRHYEELAVVDLQRYHNEMRVYNAKMKDDEKAATAMPYGAKSMNDDDDDDDCDKDDGNENSGDDECPSCDSMETETDVKLATNL